MKYDIDLQDVLTSDNMGLILGIPGEEVELTGTINGTNKEFAFPAAQYPIYPKNGLSITPQAADVAVRTKKGSTFTDVTVTSIKTLEDPDTGFDVYGIAELAAAPTTEGADTVHGTCVEEFEPFIAQGVEPTIKQDQKEIKRIYASTVLTSYGAMDIKIKSEQIMGLNTMDLLEKVLFKPYTGEGTPETGYDASELRTQPLSLYAYTPIVFDDEVIGRLVYEGCKVTPDLPAVKAGDNPKFDLELAISKTPILLLPTV